jgi:ATP:guanido phosphotransferase, N-terminal domain
MMLVFELILKRQLYSRLNLNSFTALIMKAGLDAPHLGVGIAAGEAASYDVYKDIMDIVIEGWHGYKPTDSHK